MKRKQALVSVEEEQRNGGWTFPSDTEGKRAEGFHGWNISRPWGPEVMPGTGTNHHCHVETVNPLHESDREGLRAGGGGVGLGGGLVNPWAVTRQI